MSRLKNVVHQVIFKDAFLYSAHPHCVELPDGEWVMVFNQSVRRPMILHPTEDPRYYNVVVRSVDQGKTWSTPRVAPGYDWYGVECAGLTVLRDGTLLLNQWRFKWYPLETGVQLSRREPLALPSAWAGKLRVMDELPTNDLVSEDPAEYLPWVRGSDGAYVHRSEDGGRTWSNTVPIDTTPYPGGYGMRGAIELPGGDIVLALSDVPEYGKVFVVRSADGGQTWGAPVEVAAETGKQFEEPAMIAREDGSVIMLLRENTSRYLHQCLSVDGCRTWSKPRPTSVLGYPAHLLRLPDGRFLCSYGYRDKPFGIRAVISENSGDTWDVDHPLILRDDMPNIDLGYPTSLMMADGRICTIYYGQDQDGVTSIFSTCFSLED
jgi:sialidase-1